MTDIGFGLIDKRTVLIVIFSMVLSQAILGFNLPFDTTNATSLFVSLVLLTGYIYIARTTYRLPIALFASLHTYLDNRFTYSHNETLNKFANNLKKYRDKESHKALSVHYVLNRIIGFPFSYIGSILIGLMEVIRLASSFEIWIPSYAGHGYFGIYGKVVIRWLIILDRLGLVFISVLVTMPTTKPLLSIFGIIGLITMLVIFTVRGSFTAVVKDNIGSDDRVK